MEIVLLLTAMKNGMKHIRTLKMVLLSFELTKEKFCAKSQKWNVTLDSKNFVQKSIHINFLPMLVAPANSILVLNERNWKFSFSYSVLYINFWLVFPFFISF
jgi:hypothetical protein